MLAILLMSFILVFLLWFYYYKQFLYWKNRGVPQDDAVPIFGSLKNVLLLQQSLGEYLKELHNKSTSPYTGFYIMQEPALLINDPQLVQQVLVKVFNNFSNRTTVSDSGIDKMSAYILFNSKSPLWNQIRKKINPVFSSGKIKGMFHLIDENTDDLMTHVKTNGPIINTRDVFARFTTDVISSTCFGINANSLKIPEAEFRKVSFRLFDMVKFAVAVPQLLYFLMPTIVKVLRIRFLDGYCLDFLRRVFYSTLTERRGTKSFRNDLIDILIQIKNNETPDDPIKLDDDMLLAQCVQFFVAGFETTSSSLTYLSYELAKHPHIQRKLKNEVREVLKKHGDFSHCDFLKDLNYMDLCIKESLRLRPILNFLDRRCTETVQIPGTNLVIEKGTPVYISLFGLHHNEKYHQDAKAFKPERWLEPHTNFTYMPFGEGPRTCVGQRFALTAMKTAMAKLLAEYTIEMTEKTPKETCPIEEKSTLTILKEILYLKVVKD